MGDTGFKCYVGLGTSQFPRSLQRETSSCNPLSTNVLHHSQSTREFSMVKSPIRDSQVASSSLQYFPGAMAIQFPICFGPEATMPSSRSTDLEPATQKIFVWELRELPNSSAVGQQKRGRAGVNNTPRQALLPAYALAPRCPLALIQL